MARYYSMAQHPNIVIDLQPAASRTEVERRLAVWVFHGPRTMAKDRICKDCEVALYRMRSCGFVAF